MKLTSVLFWVALAGPALVPASRTQAERSHVDANVPPPSEFDVLLERDLKTYFEAELGGTPDIEYEMLRDGPTQSGVAYPKFYVWVVVSESGSVKVRGAVRLAAIDKLRFEVTDFVSERSIRNNPVAIYEIFPARVCDSIKTRVKTRP